MGSDQLGLDLQLREGVHIDIPDDAYFHARALGSSDLKKLYWEAESWWWASFLNTRRRVRLAKVRKGALDLGTAFHDYVLLGEDAYRARFAFEPDEDRGDWIMTPVQLRKELKRMGRRVDHLNGPAALYADARKAGIGGKVWQIAWANFEGAKQKGRPYITEDEDVRIRSTAQLIFDDPALGPALRGDAGFPELAVFWRRPEDPDTLLRAKFDRLTYQRIFDLKTLGNWRGRDIDAAIELAITEQDYGIQWRFYLEAFERLIEFVQNGQIWAWAPDGGARPVGATDRAKLTDIASGGMAVWVWVFVQLASSNYGQEKAPMIIPRHMKPQGSTWNDAGVKIETALETFRRLRKQFGLNRPWSRIDEAKEIKDSDVRSRQRRDYQ